MQTKKQQFYLINKSFLSLITSPHKKRILILLLLSVTLISNISAQTPQWEFMGLAGEEIYDIAIDDSGYVYLGSDGGVFKSTDNGATWVFKNKGLGIAEALKLFIDYEGNIYLGAIGFSNTGCGLYKSTDGGEDWSKIADTLNSKPINYFEDVTIIPNQPGGTIYVSNYYGVYRSTDNGQTWQSTNFTHYGSFDIGINTNGYMFFTNETVGFSGIYRSTDLGLNWEIRTSLGFRAIAYLRDGSILAGYNEPNNSGIYKTTNNGDTWFNTNTLNYGSHNFVLDTNDDIYAAAGYVFLSTNNGISWLEYGLPGQGAYNLAIDTSGYIWSGNHLDGVYKTAGRTVPVELVSFKAEVHNNNVLLSWITASEINNRGFEIERSEKSEARRKNTNEDWVMIGFIEGNGTTTETQSYSFSDNEVLSGNYLYRLKQIDYDGKFEYSNIIEVELRIPYEFFLSQNYPNPFNPTTQINYSIKEAGLVHLKVYDILGKEIATLVNENKEAGNYSIDFDAFQLPSGVYFYQLRTSGFTQARKMILIK
jgi:photosystem II stability/assembly factor-like uncharacterized protein